MIKDGILIEEDQNNVDLINNMLSNQNEMEVFFDDDNKLKSIKSMDILNVSFISFLILIIYGPLVIATFNQYIFIK